MIRLIMVITIASLLLSGCSSKQFLYNLDYPDKSIKLDKKLNEVSGLQYTDDSTILAVQDEKAIIYTLSPTTGEILDEKDFGKDADFEGITLVDKSLYMLRSDGKIYRYKKGKETKSYNFKHSDHFDFEGLCADPQNDRLLVACKEHGDKDKRDHLFIYGFSLQEKKYEKEPVFKLNKKTIHPNFKASGIAIHPNGTIYILSSFSKTLLVVDPNGKEVNQVQLNEYIFHQPEGITFAPDGTLFISNEKRNTYPTLLKFNLDEKK